MHIAQIEREAFLIVRDSAVSRRTPDFCNAGRLREFPHEGVLASTATNNENFHSALCTHEIIAKISEPEPYGVRSVSVNMQSELISVRADKNFRWRFSVLLRCTIMCYDRRKYCHARSLRWPKFALGFRTDSRRTWNRRPRTGAAARPRVATTSRHNQVGSALALCIHNCLPMAFRCSNSVANHSPWHSSRAARLEPCLKPNLHYYYNSK